VGCQRSRLGRGLLRSLIALCLAFYCFGGVGGGWGFGKGVVIVASCVWVFGRVDWGWVREKRGGGAGGEGRLGAEGGGCVLDEKKTPKPITHNKSRIDDPATAPQPNKPSTPLVNTKILRNPPRSERPALSFPADTNKSGRTTEPNSTLFPRCTYNPQPPSAPPKALPIQSRPKTLRKHIAANNT